MKTSKTEANIYKRVKNGPLQLQTYLVTTFDFTDIRENCDYLAQYSILYKYRSGFKTKHSTDLCLSYLNDKILKGFDNGLFTSMVLIDLQNTFDTINQNLKAIGFCDDSVSWFHSYLTDWAFLVSIENTYSNISYI